MKISLSWLQDYIDWTDSTDTLCDLWTRAGLSVENVEKRGVDIPKVVVAQILDSQQHPNADRLSVCKVDDGSGQPRQIVCGAKNYKVGDKVPLALPGAVLPGNFKIKVGKLRGVESEGMMCSGRELGLSDDHEGLLILPADAPVGKPLSEIIPADTVFELEITPNRPDWLSHIGIARETAAFNPREVRVPQVTTAPARENAATARIDTPETCPFYSVRVIKGVKVAPSPGWLREKLESIGLRPINNIVDITNFVLHETGQPLHAFDAAKVQGGILVRQASEGEHLLALNGTDYALKPGMTVIADASKPLALAGIMGGEESGVTDSTVDVLLESALFHPSSIRRTSRELGLSSDSSYRFERGVDPSGVLYASARATELILQLAGGEASPEVITAGQLPASPSPITLRHARARLLLGADIPTETIRQSLKDLGFGEVSFQEEESQWSVPGYRVHDITREADLIEEISRRHGIENIPSRLSATPAPASDADSAYDFAMTLRGRLNALGFFECRTLTLVPSTDAPGGLLLRNPMGEEQAALRTSLIPGLLASAERNLRFGTERIRLFEIGRVFSAQAPEEKPALALLATGGVNPRSWRDAAERHVDLFDLKGVLSHLLDDQVSFRPVEKECGGFVLCLEISHGDRSLGWLGRLAPARERDLDARGPVVVAELDVTALQEALAVRNTAYHPIPRHPAITLDFSIVAPKSLAWESIHTALHGARDPLLQHVELFDVFEDPSGQKLPAEARSLAFSLTFQAPDRTLKQEEAAGSAKRLMDMLTSCFDVTVRQ